MDSSQTLADNDPNSEKCRACTLKHLSTVLVCLDEPNSPEKLRNAYIVGNLSHAANHFLNYDETISNAIRSLRLEIIDENLNTLKNPAEIKGALEGLILKVANWKEVEEPPLEPTTPAVKTAARTQTGCKCRKK